ncbi:MAG: zinc ribbon domain-containing protein [Candidatus Hermodarchaeota archaeon]
MVGERAGREQGQRIRKTSSRLENKRPGNKGQKTYKAPKKKKRTYKKEQRQEKGAKERPKPIKEEDKNSKEETEEDTETITRQFGITPVPHCPKCKKMGQKDQGEGKKVYACPSCQKILEKGPKTIPNDIFARFKKVVNAMIRRGRDMPIKYFRRKGPAATKTFYNRIINDPQVKKITKQAKLHNRLQRCAAQYAHYSIQEYKRRQLMVRELAILVEAILTSKEGLAELTDPDFPSYKIVKDCQGHLRAFNEHSTLEIPTESIYIQNMLRHVRNILLEQLKARSTNQDTLIEQNIQGDPVLDTNRLISDLKKHQKELTKMFLRRLSSQLTRRVTQLRKDQGPAFGQGFWDQLIEEVLGGPPQTTPKGSVILAKDHWDRRRKMWRNQLNKILAQPNDHVIATLLTAAQRILDRVTPPTTLINELFQRHRPRFWSTGDVITDWTRFLIFQLRQTILEERLALYRPIFHQYLRDINKELVKHTRTFIKVPVFKRQSIPLAQDDDYVYELQVEQEPILSKQEEEQDPRPNQIFIRLTLEPRRPCYYQLNTPDRFFDMLTAGNQPLRPVLMKRPAGGALVLAVPFSPERPNQDLEITQEDLTDTEAIALNVDLGLKTLATISVTYGVLPVPLDPRYAAEEALQAYYTDAHLEDFELARYFLDQDSIPQKASYWYQPAPKTLINPSPFFNFKRRLTNLQEECRNLKKKLDTYRNKHRPKYRRKTQYFKLKREWKRTWQKIRQLHLELARQVATRIIHLARNHQATTIRFEDLRWSQHSPKDGVGTWLATWQVHWFHGEIIKRTKELTKRTNLKVELVYAYHTSQRCSSCGTKGTRQGKTFTCPSCQRQLNSDLNAARNIALAPLSPEAIRLGERATVSAWQQRRDFKGPSVPRCSCGPPTKSKDL